MSQIQELISRLENLGHSNIEEISIKIKNTIYNGAKYNNKFLNNREFIYLIGDLPKSYLRRRKTVFLFPGDSRDWYISCYNINNQKTEYNLGKNFILTPWDLPDGSKIDTYENVKPYTRIPVEIK